MTETQPETLTAALRRLGDERATGVLEVQARDHGVLVALVDGVPTSIGPVVDVSERIGADVPAQLEAAAVIDTLVDRTVAAIVGGGGAWAWDIQSDEDLLPLPAGLAGELSRRAVDAAQALAALGAGAVLSAGASVQLHGEAAALHAALDGERPLSELAEQLHIPLPTAATWAAALADAGVAHLGDEPPTPASWFDETEDQSDASDDEPEPWVMEPAPEPEPVLVEEQPPAPAPAPEPAPEPPAPLVTEPEPATASAPEPPEPPEIIEPEPALEPEPEPEPFWVEPAAPAAAQDEPIAPEPVPPPPMPAPPPPAPAPADPVPSSVAATEPTPTSGPDGAWNDTAWLDELDDDTPTRPEPVHSAGEDRPSDARSAFAAALGDLGGMDRAAPQSAPAAPEPEPEPEPAPEPVAAADEPPPAKATPRAAPNDMAEFLRELSRLALDDD